MMIKRLFILTALMIAMFAFISCTEWRDSAGNDENSSATPEKTTYTVTFYSNDETNKSYTQIFVSGESQLLNENCFTRTGYNFAGWNTKRNGYGMSYSDRARLTATYDITLYAQWIYVGSQDTPDNPVKTYTVTFYSNDGTNKSYTQTFINGQSQNLNVNCFVRNGYTFAGWNTNADGYGTSYADKRAITIYSDKTLYAQWIYVGSQDNPDNPVQTYTVTFYSNDGTNKKYTQTFISETSQSLNTNCFFYRGYTFTGWNTKADGNGTVYTDSQSISITSDLVLYAQWKYVGGEETPDNPVKTYTVTFHSNDGTNKSYTQTFINGQSQNLNANCFTRTGYTFAGWNTEADGYGTSYNDTGLLWAEEIISDMALYAIWEINTYTVTFDANGGTGKMSSQVFTFGTLQPLNSNTSKRTGCTFKEWNTKPDGSGDCYIAGASYTFGEDTTLYAQWTANKVGITVILPEYNDAEINLQQVTNENTVTFTAADGFDSYAWYIDGEKQSETSTTFAIDTSTMKPANYKVMVIVADGDEYYSATADLEIKRVQ